jgi:hypothetical protein
LTAFCCLFFLVSFCPCNNRAKTICHNSKLALARTMPIKLVITRDNTYAKTVPKKLTITSRRRCHATESDHVKCGGKLTITSRRRCHATESDHVKCGGIAKLTESILKALTAPTRTVHKAAAMSIYLDSLEDVTERLRAPLYFSFPYCKTRAKKTYHNFKPEVARFSREQNRRFQRFS